MRLAKTKQKAQKILVVDSDGARADEVRVILEKAGFACAICEQPLKTLGLIRREMPDAVVLEVVMSGRSGFEIAARMQADPLLWRMPIVFTSDIQDSAGGNHDYFPRPLDGRRLVRTLRARIARER